MAVCKALHENDVVLYHPLNDFVEQTQTQTWTGNTSFVTGAVGNGISAINTFSSQLGPPIAIPSGFNFTTGVNFRGKSNVIWLTDTLIVIFYNSDASGIRRSSIRTANVSGTTITGFNPIATVFPSERLSLAITKLTNSTFVVGYGITGNRRYRYGEVDASGLITLGIENSVVASGGFWGGPSTKLDDTRFITQRAQIGPGSHYDMTVGQISGSGSSATITFGPDVKIGASGIGGNFPDMAMWPSSIGNTVVSGIVSWVSMNSGPGIIVRRLYVTQISISGTTITQQKSILVPGALAENHSGGNLGLAFPSTTLALTDNVFVHNFNGFNGFGPAWNNYIVIGRVDSSGNLVFNDPIFTLLDFPDSLGHTTPVTIAKVGRETDQSLDIHIHYENTSTEFVSRPGSVPPLSGGIQFGSPTPRIFEARVLFKNGLSTISKYNNGDKRVFLGSEVVGQLSGVIYDLGATSNSILTSPSGGAYPSVSTSTRMTFGVWIRDTLMTGGSFKLGRGFEVTVNPTNIVLNPSGLIWNLPLSFVLNDGNEHLLLLDFEHTTAGQWRLRTSIDGVTWVDRGLQLSGVLPVGIVDTTPEITMDNSQLDLGRWIDEVIIWKDTTLFTDQELINLHQLGSTLDAPQCDYLIHFPLSSSENSTLSINGFIPAPLPTDPIPHNDMTSLAMFGDTKDNVQDDDLEELINKILERLDAIEDLIQKNKHKINKRRKRKRQRDKHKDKKNKK